MRNASGFTLIELMITVAIVAIISSIAIPAYTDYITRGKIHEATTALLAQKVKMEQFFQDARKYATACDAGTVATPQTLKYFTLGCSFPGGGFSQFVVTATGGSTTDTSMTGWVFSINETNTRVTVSVPPGSGWSTPATNCWVAKKPNKC